MTSQINLYKVLGGGANLIEPVAIPTPQHRNLVNIATPASNEATVQNAIQAASSAPMVTAEEAQAIELESPVTVTQPKTLAKVDLNKDAKADAAIVQLSEVNIPKAKMLLEQPTNQTDEQAVLIANPVVIEENAEADTQQSDIQEYESVPEPEAKEHNNEHGLE